MSFNATPLNLEFERILLRENLETHMEPWIWERMLWTVGFLCATYLPLQCVVLWKSRGATRVAGALPLLVMVPMIAAGLRPEAYQDGSLFGMYFIFPYLPAMIYLVAVSCVGPRRPSVCPHCGHKPRVRSFRPARTADECEKCGQHWSKTVADQPPSTEPPNVPVSVGVPPTPQ